MNFKKQIRENNFGFQIIPMIDILFLLLIFFITTSIYAQWETKTSIKVPTSKTGKYIPRYPGEVIINIDAEGRIYMNLVQYSMERFTQLLTELSKTYPDQPVVIRADRSTKYESVIAVLDLCKSVDIANIAFATLPPMEPQKNK